MAHTVSGLLNTSVDDCMVTMQHITDIQLLRELLAECDRTGHKTRSQIVSRRIKQLGGAP